VTGPAVDGPLTIALPAPTPGWSTTADVIVVGSGIAGLATAIHSRHAGHRVLLVTKALVDEGSTRWAQGGVAAALSDEDSPADHLQDTLVAGAGLCDRDAVRVLAYEGPAAVKRLVRWGARFDRGPSGGFALGREGGHLRHRIAHAGGDATGVEIVRALVEAVRTDPGIELIEHALVLDLLVDDRGAAQGLTLHVMGEGQRDGVGAALAPAVVLATGGIGQVFASSTNPEVATGDGVALGLRAGAEVVDMEFIQFHPTVLWLGGSRRGRQPLITEALRGEGAVIVDDRGRRLMAEVHPLADLAPRDVVAKAIMHWLLQTGGDHVWLDARHLDPAAWDSRFPTIRDSCRANGIDPIRDLIPVAPAQHYCSGGLLTDLNGRTTVPGLFAVGECAGSGVHGANRLASNSLLEGLVFADRIGWVLSSGLPPRREPGVTPAAAKLIDVRGRATVQDAMTAGAGVLRTAESLSSVGRLLDRLAGEPAESPGTRSWETANVATVARVIVEAAAHRCETRGSHWREDFPDRDDRRWRVRTVLRRTADGLAISERTVT